MYHIDIPKNGSVVIIDDKIKEVIPLFNILSKAGISFTYYSGTDLEELPEKPIQTIRAVFLDIQLIPALNAHSYSQMALNLLEKIIPDDNGPYILLIWSTNQRQYAETLEAQIIGPNYSRRPAIIIHLDKIDYFKQEILQKNSNTQEVKFIPKSDAFKSITKKINSELEKVKVFHLFTLWSDIINNSANEHVNNFLTLFPYDNQWQNNLKKTIFKLAKAVAGDTINNIEDDEKIKYAFFSLNRTLIDTIEKNTNLNFKISLKNIKNGVINQSIIADINSKLHLMLINSDWKIKTGNLYIIPQNHTRIYSEHLDLIISERNFKATRCEEIKLNRPKLFRLDITPVCDYAQDKGYVRFLYGFIIDSRFEDEVKKKNFNNYVSPLLYINNKIVFLFIDFRFSNSVQNEKKFNIKLKPNFVVKKEIITDMQTHFSHYINRPGIIKVE